MSPRTRQLLLLFGIVALVSLAGCADDLGGPDSEVDDADDGLEDADDEAANDTDDESDADEANGETDDESTSEADDDADDSGEGDDDPIVLDGGDDDTESDDTAGDDDQADDDDQTDGNGDEGADDGSDEGADDSEDGADDSDDEPAEPDQSLLTLEVVDEDGDPIEGVDVYGLGEEHEADIPLVFEGETDEDGLYTDVIYENEYTVDLDHDEYEATSFNHTHDGELEVTVELESDGEETGELGIEVLETTWGGPADGVEVEGEREEPDEDGEPVTFTAETDDDGMAVVDVPYGAYDVELDGDDYESMEGQLEHRDVDGPTPPAIFEINLIPPEYEVTVNVVDEDGDPIDGVDIEGTSEPYYADQNDTFEITGVNGSTTFSTLGEGMLTMEVIPTETDHESETVSMSLRQNEELTVELKSSDE